MNDSIIEQIFSSFEQMSQMRHLVENMFFWYQNYTTILYYTTNEYYAESAIISERTQDMKNRTKY